MSKITESALERSFTDLLKEKPVNKIPVSDITNRCGVSRMTFYYHYDDIYDLLRQILTKGLAEICESCDPEAPWGGVTKKVYKYIKSNGNMFTNIYNSLGREQLEESFYSYIKPLMTDFSDECMKGLEIDNVNKKSIVDFFINGVVANALDWIKSGMPGDYEARVDRVIVILETGIRAAAEQLAK